MQNVIKHTIVCKFTEKIEFGYSALLLVAAITLFSFHSGFQINSMFLLQNLTVFSLVLQIICYVRILTKFLREPKQLHRAKLLISIKLIVMKY